MTQAASAPAIELVDVTKRYGEAVALDDVVDQRGEPRQVIAAQHAT